MSQQGQSHTIIDETRRSIIDAILAMGCMKGDKQYHGYGLLSIKYIAKKYDGFVNISEEDGCFSLKILMPIPNIAKN